VGVNVCGFMGCRMAKKNQGRPECIFHFLKLLVLLLFPAVTLAITPIARWDVVPYQRIKFGSSFKVGVVAFSKPGIDRVEITPTGQGYSGGTKTVRLMTLNDRVGVYEYWASLLSNEFTGNGPINVRAVVYDKQNNSRTLDLSMIVEGASAYNPKKAWVNAISGNDATGAVGNSSAPYKTVGAAVAAAQAANGGKSDGNIIYLADGTYSVNGVSASTTGEWLTISKADAATKEKVIINNGRLSTGYLKYDGVTLQSLGTNMYVASTEATRLWTNNCRRIGSGQLLLNSNPIHHSSSDHYSTGDYTDNVDYAYRRAALV